MVAIRSYVAGPDEEPVYRLWEALLGRTWPLARRTFRRVTLGSGTYRPGDHVVAVAGAQIVGFAGTQTRWIPGEVAPRGAILAILVAPTQQRAGVGRALLAAAVAGLRARRAETIQLGGGGLSFFWPGVPTNLPDAWPFFAACGWPAIETSYDLLADLRVYATPPEVHARTQAQGFSILMAASADAPAVLAFELQHFPGWHPFFTLPFTHGEPGDVLVARDAHGGIVGSALVLDPRSRWWRGCPWGRLLGARTGGVGTLGVMEVARGRGIGLALAAQVSEIAQARGLHTSYIGWTWLVDWYGRLGYRVWRDYSMSWQRFPA